MEARLTEKQIRFHRLDNSVEEISCRFFSGANNTVPKMTARSDLSAGPYNCVFENGVETDVAACTD